MPDEKRKPNRLINERSPYLLKHAYNPVDWYPWGEEAFEKAQKEDKPLFVSIGYFSCHWCSVMERESFEDEQVAAILNEYFVPIKVDREERADIDALYMEACQVLGSNGGWPLNVFVDKSGKPFFAGTYFPKEDMYNMAGFITVLKLIANYWEQDRERLMNIGAKVAKIIDAKRSMGQIGENWPKEAADYIKEAFDHTYGGLLGAPKFPMPSMWLFLLRYSRAFDDKEALKLFERTLSKMAMGGIYDHVEGGFCRYSTDERWLVPHFEKMLYDNAQLISLYAEAYLSTGKEEYKNVAEKTIAYVFRELKDEGGAFYTAQDADSAGIEGDYYVFSQQEIKKALKEELYDSFIKVFDISAQGNFEEKNVLSANTLNFSPEIQKALDILKQLRQNKVKPALDDKILSGQNGLMITALAKAGRIFGQEAYIKAAKKAADFVLQNMILGGRLMTSYRKGLSPNKAVQLDYAYFIDGLLELYEATFEDAYLLNALTLAQKMIELFWDEKDSGFYMTGKDSKELYAQIKDIRDGVVPSGNAAAAKALFVLSRLCADKDYAQYSIKTLEASAKQISAQQASFTAHLIVQLFMLTKNTDVTLTEGEGIEEMKAILKYDYSPYRHTVLASSELKNVFDHLKGYEQMESAGAYVCENETCLPMIKDPEELRNILK